MDTSLHKNAFAVLGVSTRDNRRRIVEAAEERGLEFDHDLCQKARSDLTNPRARVTAEMAWLPGVSPRRALQLLDDLARDPVRVHSDQGLPTLAHLNIMAAAFELTGGNESTVSPGHHIENNVLATFIQDFARKVDDLSADEIMRDLNEDRAVSGFPEVRSVDQLQAELAERKRYYRDAIKGALNRLDSTNLVEVMTDVVDGATCSGEDHAPVLVDELVDSYAVETQSVLESEGENVKKIIAATQRATAAGETAVKPLIDTLSAVVRNWDSIAQPIQLSSKARGIDHDPSRDLAYEIRSLAVDLFNKHDMLAQSQRLTGLLQELFSEVPDVSERVDQDADALSDISQRRNEGAAIDPIRSLCDSALKTIERNPGGANSEGRRVLDEGGALLKAAPIKVNSPTYLEAKDMMAIAIMQCAVAYGNETSKWGSCISLLESALSLASDSKLRRKLNENLGIVRANHASMGDLEPIKKAPSLQTINGIGVKLYGSTDKNPTDGSYMATYYFVLLFVPVFPIARYRVIPTDGGYRFIGKGPLRTFDKWHLAISLGLIALIFLNG